MRLPARVFGAAVAGVLAATVMAACAPGEPASSGPAGGTPVKVDFASFKGKSMTYLYFTDGPDEQATRAAIGRFEAATGATVNLQIVPYADLDTALQARLSAGNAPDAARVSDWHAYADSLVDFKDYFGAGYPGEFLDGEAKAAEDPAGRMLAVPSDVTINGPFVNVDAFKAAGVPVPTESDRWTWDQLIAAATKVAQVNKMESAIALDKSGNRISTILSQYGTSLINQSGQEGLDPAKAAKALGMLNDLLQQGRISKDFWLAAGSKYKGANEIFLAGQAAVYLSGPWQVGGFAKSAKFAWAAAPNPCVQRCGGFPGGKMMVAFKNGKEPTLGAAFVQWMNRTENQREQDRTAYWLPTRKDLAASGVQYASRQADMTTFLKEIAKTPTDTYPGAFHPAFSNAATALVKEFDRIAAGQEDVPTGVADLRQKVDAAVRAAK